MPILDSVERLLNIIKCMLKQTGKRTGSDRDLNRTRERIMASALAEFSAKGFAGARTDGIARRAGVREGMIFYCFKSKENLYRQVLRRKLAEAVDLIESRPDDDFAESLVRGYESACDNVDHIRMCEWEALGGRKRKPAAEEERRALLRTRLAQLRRAKAGGELPADADERMLVLVSIALRIFPLAFPQFARLAVGMEPTDPKFRRGWSKCLRWLGECISDSQRLRDGARGAVEA